TRAFDTPASRNAATTKGTRPADATPHNCPPSNSANANPFAITVSFEYDPASYSTATRPAGDSHTASGTKVAAAAPASDNHLEGWMSSCWRRAAVPARWRRRLPSYLATLGSWVMKRTVWFWLLLQCSLTVQVITYRPAWRAALVVTRESDRA